MAVKRKADSDSLTCFKRLKDVKVDESEEVHPSGTWAYLPDSILINIFLRLPIASILSCRCVCNSWRSIILDPYFAKMHFQTAPRSILLRTNSEKKRVSRTLHLLDFDGLERLPCNHNCSFKNSPTSTCACHVKLGIKLKLPLRDSKSVLDTMLEARRRGKKRTTIGCKPKDDRFNIVASYNGLLCLCEPLFKRFLYGGIYVTNLYLSTLVCNPLTGEFIRLPESGASRVFECRDIHFGLGYVKKTDEYKMVKIYQWSHHDLITVDVYTLGTKSWRNIKNHGLPCTFISYHTSLDGSLYWLTWSMSSMSNRASILCIDLESETLNRLPCPFLYETSVYNLVIGVLKGSLCICDPLTKFKFWTIKKHGDGHSWTEVLNLNVIASTNVMDSTYWAKQHIDFIGHGMLGYDCEEQHFIYYDLEKHLFSYFECPGTLFKLESIAYSPSLIRLKDSLKGDDVEVFNVHSRCATFKLREDEEVLYLRKQKPDKEYLWLDFGNF